MATNKEEKKQPLAETSSFHRALAQAKKKTAADLAKTSSHHRKGPLPEELEHVGGVVKH